MSEARKRHMLAVTMLPHLYEAAKAAAAKRDMPVTSWVREVVVAELERMGHDPE